MAGVKSVERAISLLSEVARRPRGLVELSEATELPTSTTARLLSTLEDLDALRRDEDGRYDLGPTVWAMATTPRGEPRLRDVAQPYLDELAVALDEAVCLSVVSGEDNVTIAQVDIPRPVQAENWEGSRWPLADGPAGHAVLSTWTRPAITDFIDRHPEVEDLAAHLRDMPPSGVWWSVDHYVEDLTSATVPLVSRDGLAIGTLYAYGPSYRFPAQAQQGTVEEILTDCGQRLSQAWQERAVGTLEAG